VRRGLSAGRVQTVALRLIVERELEIRAFIPQEYWSIHAMLDAGAPPLFEAKLAKFKGEDIEIHNQEGADAVLAALNKAKWGSGFGHAKRKAPQSAAAFYNFEIAAGCVQPFALHREAHHGASAAFV